MASRSHRSPRRPSRPQRRTALVCAVAVAAVGLVVSLVVAFGPGRAADAGGAATSAAGARASARPTPAERKSPSASPTTSTEESATPGKTSPSATPTSESPEPTATNPRENAGKPASGTASLAGRIRPEVTYQGVATLYDAGTGDGACSYGPSDDLMIAAMNTTDYETSKACGAYVLVRAGGASITVRITNECPAPCKPGQLDLSAQAFAKLADPSRGQIPITWTLLSPGRADTLSIRYKTGSSRYWCGIQVIGHRNPVARLEVRAGGGWTRLPRTEYNYFLSEQGTGCGDAIKITDIYGEQLTVDGIAVRPEAVQPTRVQFAEH